MDLTRSSQTHAAPLTLAPQFFVGTMVFTNLTLAVAEHARQKGIKA